MSKKKILKKIGHITVDILEAVFYITEVLATAVERKTLSQKMWELGYGDDDSPRIFNNLRNLIDYGYLEEVVVDHRRSVRLTHRGRLKLLEKSKDQKVDGKWRILSFDVPEDIRAKRDLFRASIKRIGFRQVQKSLWACPFIKADEVEIAIDEYGVKDYVAYFVIEKTDIEPHLKALFRDIL